MKRRKFLAVVGAGTGLSGCTGINTIESIDVRGNISVPAEALDRRRDRRNTRTREETPTETTTDEEETEEQTETTQTTEEPSEEVIFEDTWEDGDYTNNPVWTTGNEGEAQVRTSSTRDLENHGWSCELETGESGTARIHSYAEFDFRRSFTCEGLVKLTGGDFRSSIKLANTSYPRVNLRISPSEITVGGMAFSELQSAQVSSSEGWYRYKLRFDGDSLYRAKIWSMESEEPSWQLSVQGREMGEGSITLEHTSQEGESSVQHAYIRVEGNE